MSVRVNLLPQEQFARQAAARQRIGVVIAVIALLVLLGVLFLFQSRTLAAAEAEAEAARTELAGVQAEQAQLIEFQQIRDERQQLQDAVAGAMMSEISFAGLLQDIAAVTPGDVALTDVDITRIEQVAADGDAVRPVIARLVVGGESIAGHAPGLERLLLEFDKIGAFFDVYFTSAVADEEDPEVSIFTFEVELGEEALAGRYLEGLPEALR